MVSLFEGNEVFHKCMLVSGLFLLLQKENLLVSKVTNVLIRDAWRAASEACDQRALRG